MKNRKWRYLKCSRKMLEIQFDDGQRLVYEGRVTGSIDISGEWRSPEDMEPAVRCALAEAALGEYADKKHWLALFIPSKTKGETCHPGREWNRGGPGYRIARRALGLEE